jgi:hypothetical protein
LPNDSFAALTFDEQPFNNGLASADRDLEELSIEFA